MDGLENCGFLDLDANLSCLHGRITCKVTRFSLSVISIDADLLRLRDKLLTSCNASDLTRPKENRRINTGKQTLQIKLMHEFEE